MKRIIQLVLVLFLILISVIVYKIYFLDKKEVLNKEIQKKTNIIDKKTSNQTKNNLILEGYC